MWYIYKMEYYSTTKKNEIMSFLAKWTDPEIVILSEIRHREANIWYCLYVQSKKKGTNKLIYKRDVESQM